ncbi:superoxide-generating NADPH oxidase flavocytochrome [Tieghemostelium lacteum]|uniref:Superoxide-generating NADPH oxidase flavocytochrome n=1 Tax=Tieghemostelium lacteum TaxID=361077 RepID=A0A151Z815_TIELA|nr:superoxide-generating NADPH oxidase flavocytochrome [Tieghemostelium lacteum]|eukprot:KYQ90113.1 superoxide-generating NADPH oxidase flavocytochrome [Tieghemostelium lacteum]
MEKIIDSSPPENIHAPQLKRSKSLYRIPNIGANKTSNLTDAEKLLYIKGKENEVIINEYLHTHMNDPEALKLNKQEFSQLFNIPNLDDVNSIFNLFDVTKIVQPRRIRITKDKFKSNDIQLHSSPGELPILQPFQGTSPFLSNTDPSIELNSSNNMLSASTSSTNGFSNLSTSNSGINTDLNNNNNNNDVFINQSNNNIHVSPTVETYCVNPPSPGPKSKWRPQNIITSRITSKSKKNGHIISRLDYVDLVEVATRVKYFHLQVSNSTEQQHIRDSFALYDIFNRGFITRDDLKKVLIFRSKQSGLAFSDETFDFLVDHIFDQFDKIKDNVIHFEEFKEEYTKIDESEKELHPFSKKAHNIRRYFKIEGVKIFWIVFWILINIGLGFASWHPLHKYHQGAIGLFGKGLYVSRISAALVTFNASLILLTMCKQIITWLRKFKLCRIIIPLDKNIIFHKLIASVIIVAAFAHVVGWVVSMSIASNKPEELFIKCFHPHYDHRPSAYHLIFASLPGITGIILIVILTIMVFTSLKSFRNKHYEGFYYTHHLFIAFYIVIIIHGLKGWIKAPGFWKWFIAPVAIYIFDRGFRIIKRTYKVKLADISLEYPSILVMKFEKPKKYRYRVGQYLQINVPKISKLQWHPITISSSPLEKLISLHIRVFGNEKSWTSRLQRHFQQIENDPTSGDMEEIHSKIEQTKVRIDGPLGSSSQYVLNYKLVLMVGAGIGVTPMTSLLQDIKIKKEHKLLGQNALCELEHNNNYSMGNLEKVHFFWLNRDPLYFQWIEDLLIDIYNLGNHSIPKISVHTFNTSLYPKNDVRVFMLWRGLDKLFETQGLDPITHLPFKTHWSRPNWDAIFTYYSNKYKGQEIGVFCCGPKDLSKELYDKCRYYTSIKGTKFKFHKENF